MIETAQVVRVGEDGMVHLAVPGVASGTRVVVTVSLASEEEFETSDSNPDVEDFA